MRRNAPAISSDEPFEGDFHGLPTARITSDDLWVDVLATAGPRIVRLGLTGSSRNVLAETPGEGWETPYGRYELFGGHRLWFAPEDPDRVAVPDGAGLVLAREPDGFRLTGAAEGPTGLVRSMTLRLARGNAGLTVRHELGNASDAPVELAPWAITQLPLGGIVLMPQPAAMPGHDVRPNRTLVLWPYSSWEDRRFRPRDGLLILEAQAGPGLKLGYLNEVGWVGYVRDGMVLVRRFVPLTGSTPSGPRLQHRGLRRQPVPRAGAPGTADPPAAGIDRDAGRNVGAPGDRADQRRCRDPRARGPAWRPRSGARHGHDRRRRRERLGEADRMISRCPVPSPVSSGLAGPLHEPADPSERLLQPFVRRRVTHPHVACA